MHVAAAQVLQLGQGAGGVGVSVGGHGQGDEDLVGVQARVAAPQVPGLEGLDRLDRALGQQVDVPVDARQALEGIEQHCRAAAQQRRGLAELDRPVGQLDRGCGRPGGGRQARRGRHHRPVRLLDPEPGHEQGDAGGLDRVGHVALLGDKRPVVAADDLLLAGRAADLVIADAVAGHIDAHLRGGAVGRGAQDLLEQALQDGEDLDVPVVVDGLDPVGRQVEGVDHVDVVEVGRGGLVGDVDRVVQGQVPDREGLELGVAGGDPADVVVVHLRQAGRHLAAARPRGGDDDEVAGGPDVLVAPVALRRDDAGDVAGVAGDRVVAVDRDAQLLQLALEVPGLGVVLGPLGDDDASHQQAVGAEGVDVPQNLVLVAGAEVSANLIAGEIPGVDGDDDLDLVGELGEHDDLVVRGEAGQHARGVHVVDELAPELEVEPASELGAALRDALGLHMQVLVPVEAYAHAHSCLSRCEWARPGPACPQHPSAARPRSSHGGRKPRHHDDFTIFL